MDPVCHSLAGACLAESGLARRTPLARAALIIGANLPDVDGLAQLGGLDTALAHRRGWTHGVLAMGVLPLLLTGALLAYDAWRARRAPERARARPGPLLALCALGVLSHPALDWLNTYGVRLLMPFDGRWFYGDALFIVDPWMWLLLGGGTVLARQHGRFGRFGWPLLAVFMVAVVAGGRASAPPAAAWAWLVGLALVVGAVLRGGAPWRGEAAARAALVVATLYVAATLGLATAGRHVARTELAALDLGPVEALMVGPRPADLTRWDVVARTPDGYHAGTLAWLESPRVTLSTSASLPSSPEARAALAAPCVSGLANWLRFPVAVTAADGGDATVSLFDLRYAARGGTGWAAAAVRLGPGLEPLACDRPDDDER